MKHLTKMLIAFCLFGSGTTILAQNTIPATGGNATGTGGTVSYTVGQVVYNTVSGTVGTISQGVQQPYEISVVTGIEETIGISLEMLIYPNPATDFIKLKIENYEVQNLRYQLYNINSTLLLDNKVEGKETNISMQNLSPSTYFLKVTDNKKVIKTFKIIKK